MSFVAEKNLDITKVTFLQISSNGMWLNSKNKLIQEKEDLMFIVQLSEQKFILSVYFLNV